ncbi:hypothetical protein JOF29_000034 [Kribbella aluminosa]|uniref:Integral membrane protein n=1 Tax=Kribbella aluminosa TaxID=416017 RepID=A0ABS4UBD5_9ACTN|nr:hypothetical protein [Kribbella aluminosa]MBP2348951.1 hypothetical protein [Kribbella aluminosa]
MPTASATVTVQPSAPIATGTETTLTLLVLATGGISPLLVVAATANSSFSLQVLFWALGLPGMAIVAAVYLYARAAGLERLQNRIAVGVTGGITLTLALDLVRGAGVHLGYLPDSITMFGNLITGAQPMAGPTPASYTLGAVYHLFNGISFALVYSILFGRTRWWGPVLYAVLFVETAMMTLPPMEPQFGPFGLDKYGTIFNGYYLITLLAHLAMGLALAADIGCMARHRGLLPALLTRRPTTQPAP